MTHTNIKLKVILFFIFFSFFEAVYAQEADGYTLEASIKIQSIRKTTLDLIQIYREIGATPQQVAVPFVFFSFLGYPNYPAIAQDANVCIFVYSSPNTSKRKYIIAAKLIEGSNIQRILESLGGNTQLYNDWTFFTKKREDFDLIKDKQSLLADANDRAKNDIKLTTKPSIISCTKLSENQDLKNNLKYIDEAQINLNVSDNQIDIISNFFYNKEGYDFADWLIKNINKPGLVTKILQKDKNEIKVNLLIERKALSSVFNQLEGHIGEIGIK